MELIKRTNANGAFPWHEFFGKDWFQPLGGKTLAPAVNIRETEKSFVLELAVPGLKKEDFQVQLETDSFLTVSAEVKQEKEEKPEGNYTRREFSYHSFRRSFSLPESVNVSAIEATYRDGVLALTLPKKEEKKEEPTRRIEIR